LYDLAEETLLLSSCARVTVTQTKAAGRSKIGELLRINITTDNDVHPAGTCYNLQVDWSAWNEKGTTTVKLLYAKALCLLRERLAPSLPFFQVPKLTLAFYALATPHLPPEISVELLAVATLLQ